MNEGKEILNTQNHLVIELTVRFPVGTPILPRRVDWVVPGELVMDFLYDPGPDFDKMAMASGDPLYWAVRIDERCKRRDRVRKHIAEQITMAFAVAGAGVNK